MLAQWQLHTVSLETCMSSASQGENKKVRATLLQLGEAVYSLDRLSLLKGGGALDRDLQLEKNYGATALFT